MDDEFEVKYIDGVETVIGDISGISIKDEGIEYYRGHASRDVGHVAGSSENTPEDQGDGLYKDYYGKTYYIGSGYNDFPFEYSTDDPDPELETAAKLFTFIPWEAWKDGDNMKKAKLSLTGYYNPDYDPTDRANFSYSLLEQEFECLIDPETGEPVPDLNNCWGCLWDEENDDCFYDPETGEPVPNPDTCACLKDPAKPMYMCEIIQQCLIDPETGEPVPDLDRCWPLRDPVCDNKVIDPETGDYVTGGCSCLYDPELETEVCEMLLLNNIGEYPDSSEGYLIDQTVKITPEKKMPKGKDV
jgi:hypothetical protein